MYISSLIKLIAEAYSFAGFIVVVLLPTLYITHSFFAKTKSNKSKSKFVDKQYNEIKLQEQLSNLEARVNQRLVEASDRMQHQYTSKQSKIENLHERMEAFEAQFEQEMSVHKLIFDNKSLLLDVVLQSQKTHINCAERLGLQDHNNRVDQTHQMKSLNAAIQGIADTTKTFNDLLPRVLALEICQMTPPQEKTTPKFNEFEQQIKGLSQKMDQIVETLNDCIQRSKGDQFTLKTLVKHNRTILETKMNEMEAEIKAHLANYDRQIIQIVKDGQEEFSKIRNVIANADIFCADLKERLFRLEEGTATA